MSAPPGPDVFDFVDAAYDFAAVLCAHMVTEGYSVLLLGVSGTGKSVVSDRAEEKVGQALARNIAEWNEGSGMRCPPPTDKVAYVLLSTPIGVSLHDALPAHDNGLEAVVRRCVHPGWVR